MTVANLITMIRDQTGVSSDNISDAVMITYVNNAYHNIENAIVDKVDEDYFWDRFETDTVADQSEYVLQSSAAATEGISKIKRIEIKRNTVDEYHTLIDPTSLNSLKYSDDYAKENESTQAGKWEFRE